MSAMEIDAASSQSTTSRSNFAGIRELGVRACGTCVKAKVKCIPNVQRGKCHRCNRLDKSCEPSSTPSRKRATHVAQLEQKLDNLVTLLSGPNRGGDEHRSGSSSSPSKSPAAFGQPHSIPNTINRIPETPSVDFTIPNSAVAPSTSTPPYDIYVARPRVYDFGITNQEASFLLLEYRTQQAGQLPFVAIPPDATSESLRRERPMLWKAVMTAASYQNALRQEALGWKLMEEFASRIMLRAEKSLDLLQALIVHLTWYHYHSVSNPQVQNLLALANTMAVSLGYHRPQTSKSHFITCLDEPESISREQWEPEKTPVTSKTLEEWRALAGCFFLSAITTSCCRLTKPAHTQHLEYICKTLTQSQEYETDRLIHPLITVQNVILKISTAFADPNLELGTAPTRMFIQSLHSELQAMKNGLPLEIAEDYTFEACYQMAEIAIFEISLYRPFHPNTDRFCRLSMLNSCLVAVKVFYTANLAQNAVFATSFACFRWTFNAHVLVLGAKLAAHKADGWDARHVHEALDCFNTINVVMRKFEGILQRRLPHGDNEVFERYLQKMRRFKAHGTPHRPDAGSQSGHPFSESSHRFEPSSFGPEVQSSGLDTFTVGPDDDFWKTLFEDDNDWMTH